MITDLANIGGLLFLLAFVHFIVDWGFQSHWEAMHKATQWKVRARHCTVYTFGMCLTLLPLEFKDAVFLTIVLWVSHFLIDTYMPVYAWAKYIRKPIELTQDARAVVPSETGGLRLARNETERFKAFARTPIGLFLVIAMDQAWHLLFLVPIATVAVWPHYRLVIYLGTCLALLGLAILVYSGFRRMEKNAI